MCGLPGYGPGDLIDFEFSGDTVEVTFSAGIDRPLQLTSPEATGLLVALRALADIPGVVDPEAARSAIAKIAAAAGAAGHDNIVSAVDEPAPVESRAAAAVRAAVRDKKALAIDYYAASHDTLTSRDRRPHPGAAGRRTQLPGGLVTRIRRRSAVPLRPDRGRHRARRASRPARAGAASSHRTRRCSTAIRHSRRRGCG